MRIYDTNIWLYVLKGRLTAQQIDTYLADLSAPDDVLLLPAAVKAELLSLADQKGWGKQKLEKLGALLEKSLIVHTSYEIVAAYAAIDAASAGYKNRPNHPGMGGHTMGKNDLWIAATAMVTNAILLTSDRDFDHLNGHFIQVVCVTP